MTLLMTSKGIPFMTAGSEMGRTKKGDSNSYKSSDDINQIDWSRAKSMPALPQWYKTMMAVRTNMTAINSNSFVTPTWVSKQGHVVAYTYHNSTSGEWSKVCVLYNNDTTAYPSPTSALPLGQLLRTAFPAAPSPRPALTSRVSQPSTQAPFPFPQRARSF